MTTTLEKKIRKEQVASAKGRSCRDHFLTLRQILEEAREWNSTFYANFIDFEKTFDNTTLRNTKTDGEYCQDALPRLPSADHLQKQVDTAFPHPNRREAGMHTLPIFSIPILSRDRLDHDKWSKRSKRHSMESLKHAQRPWLCRWHLPLSPPPHRHAGHDRGNSIHSCYSWTQSQHEENQAHESEPPLRRTFKKGWVFVSIKNIWKNKKISLKTLLLQKLRSHYAILWVWIMEFDKCHLYLLQTRHVSESLLTPNREHLLAEHHFERLITPDNFN